MKYIDIMIRIMQKSKDIGKISPINFLSCLWSIPSYFCASYLPLSLRAHWYREHICPILISTANQQIIIVLFPASCYLEGK